MQETTNYKLKKIELADSPPDITIINPNWDTIDAKLKTLEELNNYLDVFVNNARFKIGEFSRDATLKSSNQIISGIGFKPSAVIFLASNNLYPLELSIGIDNALTRLSLTAKQHVTVGGFAVGGNTAIFIQRTATDHLLGIINSLDIDGFTIAWTKVGSPTGIVRTAYLAFK